MAIGVTLFGIANSMVVHLIWKSNSEFIKKKYTRILLKHVKTQLLATFYSN